MPADQVVHGARFSLDAQRGGWNASIWWNPARRTGWRAWGRAGSVDYDPRAARLPALRRVACRAQRCQPAARSRASRGRGWAARDLDRFSRYTFGTFDNRLRGYPSALIRYDRGAVLRNGARVVGASGWSASTASSIRPAVHDPGFGRGCATTRASAARSRCPRRSARCSRSSGATASAASTATERSARRFVRVSGYKVF